MPIEYLELLLCRDLYHCPPDQLPDFETIQQHLTLIAIEHKLDRRTRL